MKIKKYLLYLGGIIAVVILLFLMSFQSILAACTAGNITRSNWITHWTFLCNTPSSVTQKVSQAIGIWDNVDKYAYQYHTGCSPYAFNWGYVSFQQEGLGNIPGTTIRDISNGKIQGATSYLNSDKTWFNSSVENASWPTDSFDLRTVALHEIGHWMVLEHPSACGQNHPEAVLEVTNTTKFAPRADDLNGLSILGLLK